MVWSWFPNYFEQLLGGLWLTLELVFIAVFFGMLLAIPIGLVQVTGPKWLGRIALGFCTVIRGTPLLIQLWLIYYGLGFDLSVHSRHSRKHALALSAGCISLCGCRLYLFGCWL